MEGKLNGMTSDRKTNQEKLLTIGNKLRVMEGRWVEGWGDRVMGIKEGT